MFNRRKKNWVRLLSVLPTADAAIAQADHAEEKETLFLAHLWGKDKKNEKQPEEMFKELFAPAEQ